MPNDVAWLERLSIWRGSVDSVIKDISKNQDELEAKINALWSAHSKCREQMLTTTTKLATLAQAEGRRWGIIYGILSGIIVSVIGGILTYILIKGI